MTRPRSASGTPGKPYLQDFVQVTRETSFVTLKGVELL